MKYLPLNQSVLNKTYKYSYKAVGHLNAKFEFVKYWAVYENSSEGGNGEEESLFIKYMNNNIYINW
jgi:hypothetical protein